MQSPLLTPNQHLQSLGWERNSASLPPFPLTFWRVLSGRFYSTRCGSSLVANERYNTFFSRRGCREGEGNRCPPPGPGDRRAPGGAAAPRDSRLTHPATRTPLHPDRKPPSATPPPLSVTVYWGCHIPPHSSIALRQLGPVR